MTKPKNRPDGMAVRPGSHASASRSTTVGRVGRSVGEVAPEPVGDLGGVGRGRDVTVAQARQPARPRGRAPGRAGPPPRPQVRLRCLGHRAILVPSWRCPSRPSAAVWRSRAATHAARLAPYVEPHLARRRAGEKHPVHDFLFTLLLPTTRAAAPLAPGFRRRSRGRSGVRRAEGLRATATRAARRRHVASQRPLLEAIHRLLAATAARPAHTGCFGLHEWAMVYRASPTRDPAPAAAAARRCRHRRGRRVAPDRVLPLRRVPLLHRRRPPAQHARSPAATTDRTSSSRAASTPGWTSTSTPSG